MRIFEFYKLLNDKGYKNEEIEEVLLEFAKPERVTVAEEEKIADHIFGVLELDRLRVFKAWYPDSPEYESKRWQARIFEANSQFTDGVIIYCIDYILNELEENEINYNQSTKSNQIAG